MPKIKPDRAAPGGNTDLVWGSDLAAETLRRLGIRYITHNPGSSFRGLHDSIVNYLGNEAPTLLLSLNENQAVAIAHGYAKVTGKPMGVILHANVGLLNAAMSIFNAWVDRVPIYIIGAGGPADADKRLPWIHWIHSARDQASYVRDFTKWDDEPRSHRAMVESLLRAHFLGGTAPMGPTYVTLDALLQETALDHTPDLPDVARFQPAPPPAPDHATLTRAVDLLRAAEHPVILAGRVSRDTEAWARRIALAERLGARVITDTKTASAFPTRHPLHVGMSYHFRGAQIEALKSADLILSLDWIDLSGALKSTWPDHAAPVPVINASVDFHLHQGTTMDHFGLPPADVTLAVPSDSAVSALLDRLEDRPAAMATTSARRQMLPAEPDWRAPAKIVSSDIGHALRVLRTERPFTISRLPLGFDTSMLDFAEPLDFLGNDGGAGIGSGPGNTIGAALALIEADRPVIGVIGDSDFLQGSTAVWSAAHYGIPAILLVVNNRSHLNDELIQERIALQRGRNPENKWIGQRIDDPAVDIAAIAGGYGATVLRVDSRDRLPGALREALAARDAGATVVMDVAVMAGNAERLSEFRAKEGMQLEAANGG